MCPGLFPSSPSGSLVYSTSTAVKACPSLCPVPPAEVTPPGGIQGPQGASLKLLPSDPPTSQSHSVDLTALGAFLPQAAHVTHAEDLTELTRAFRLFL